MLLESQLAKANLMALANELPDAIITTATGLKITPLDAAVPDEAQALIDQSAALLPHIKITELLMEVDGWTPGFDSSSSQISPHSNAIKDLAMYFSEFCNGANRFIIKLSWQCNI